MKRKIVLSMSMAIILAFSAVGCSSGEEPTTSSEEATVDDGESVVTIMSVDYNGNPLSNESSDTVKEMVSDYTGIRFADEDMTWVPSDVYTEKIGLTLLDKDNMPMILTVLELNASIIQAAESGAFWDLSDYIFDEEKYPNLSQANENVLKQVTLDDKIVGVYRARPVGRNGFGYRENWAENLGLEAPETIEDLYNMAYAFTYDDPDGNGVDDTYGFLFSKNTVPLDMIQVIFDAGNEWVERDGELVPSHMTDEYFEALQFMKKIYDDGLVPEDWAVREPSTLSDSVRTGEGGIILDVLDGVRSHNDYFTTNEVPAVTGDGYAYMHMQGTLSKEPGGEQKVLATTGMNGFFAITKAAETEEELEAALTFLDKMCDDDMLVLSMYGLEGETYEFNENGEIVNTVEGADYASTPHNGLNQLDAFIPNEGPVSIGVAKSDDKKLEEAIKADNVQYAVYNPAVEYLNNSETYAKEGVNLDAIIEQARTQYVFGNIDEDQLRAKWDEWAAAGGQDVIDEVNEQYQQ